MFIVLDNIRSGWNVGSIFRTCDALGFQLILVGYTPRPIGQTLPIIHKTAIGAENSVLWTHFEHAQEVFSQYEGMHLGLEINETSQNLLSFLKQAENNSQFLNLEKTFLWFGNEIHGLNPQIIPNFTATLHLPMTGIKESLNVANCVCAAGYLFQYALTI